MVSHDDPPMQSGESYPSRLVWVTPISFMCKSLTNVGQTLFTQRLLGTTEDISCLSKMSSFKQNKATEKEKDHTLNLAFWTYHRSCFHSSFILCAGNARLPLLCFSLRGWRRGGGKAGGGGETIRLELRISDPRISQAGANGRMISKEKETSKQKLCLTN